MLHVSQEEMEAVQLAPGQKNFCAEYEVKAKVGAGAGLTGLGTRPDWPGY